MSNPSTAYAGSIPENYEKFLGPYIFEPYAADLAERVMSAVGAAKVLEEVPPAGAAGAEQAAGVGPARIKTVLETACGTGRVTGHLRSGLPGDVHLLATDLNPDMLAIAKKINPDPSIEWRVADAQALPFEDNYFDLVVCQFGLMLVPDKARALAEAYRVLRPGGQIFLNTWDRLANNPAFFLADQLVSGYFPSEPPLFFHIPFSMYDKNELISLLRGAGFQDSRISLVKKDGTSASAADTARGMLDGTPMFTVINQRDPELLPVIRKDLERALGKEFGTAPMNSPMQAWVVEARKGLIDLHQQ